MAGPIAILERLTKRYGSVRALDELSVEIGAGPVGLLGPNGAGKTTLLKLLLGLHRPDGGRLSVLALDPSTARGRLAVRRAVGYMPEGDCLIPGMSAVELVATLGRLSGMRARDALMRSHEVLDYVGLEEARYRGSEEYSTGMKQRLKLAQALVHDPPFLLLDEPTNGLDPKGRREMLALVHDLGHAQGKNLLLCSHLLPDVEQCCDAVVLLYRGRLLCAGAIAELTAAEEPAFEVEASEPERLAEALELAGHAVRRAGQGLSCRLAGADADELFALADASGVVVTRVAAQRASLEDVFLGALSEAEARA
jgi:ABC-2 type transport system ATP-binding protein